MYDTTYTKFGYAEGILPIVNCTNDLKELDRFITSCVIACDTKKYKIGGLGYNKTGKDGVIVRGKGRNIAMNNFKAPALDNYTSLSHMQILFKQNRTVYETYVKDMMS